MVKTWLWADPHLGHKNIVRFTKEDGSFLRPWRDIDEHDNHLCDMYNELIRPEDRVYILGDFGLPRFADRLNGRKVLVKGNHDIDKLSKYSAFEDIRAYVVKKGFILSHIPIHPGSMGRWELNIHGHLHASSVRLQKMDGEINDPRYRCVSVEQTDFKPIELDTVLKEAGLK